MTTMSFLEVQTCEHRAIVAIVITSRGRVQSGLRTVYCGANPLA